MTIKCPDCDSAVYHPFCALARAGPTTPNQFGAKHQTCPLWAVHVLLRFRGRVSVKSHEKKISDGLLQRGAEEHAAELHELVHGYYSLKHVRRSVGRFGVPNGWVPNSINL